MVRALLLLIVGFIVLPMGATLDAANFGVDIDYWLSELTGEVKVTSAGFTGTKADFDDDLDIDLTEGIPEVEIWFKFGEKNKLSLSYFEVEHEGRKTLTKDIYYKGFKYTIGYDVKSKLETEMFELMYGRTLLEREGGELSLLLGAKYLTFEGSLTGTSGGTTTRTSEEIEAPVPVIGIGGGINITDKLSFKGEISGITVDVSDLDATLVDTTITFGYSFNENWSLACGYRYFDIDGESDDDKADFTLEGPMVFLKGCI